MQTQLHNTNKARSLRLKEVLERIPVSRSTWLAGVKDGLYPQPIQLGMRITAWRESDIADLVQNGVKASVKGGR